MTCVGLPSLKFGQPGKLIDELYSIMQSLESKLGGGEGIQGIYGSITQNGMQRIYDCLKHNCAFDANSTLVDIGAGLGRPLLHAMLYTQVKNSFGVELDVVKVTKANTFLPKALDELLRRGWPVDVLKPPEMQCASIEEVHTLNPATHAFSFWEGVPMSGKAAFGRLFAASKSLQAVCVVQRSMRKEDPARFMLSLGFGPLLQIANFPVKMSGSGRSFQAYVFSKITPSSALFLQQACSPQVPPVVTLKVPVPGHEGLSSKEPEPMDGSQAPLRDILATTKATEVLAEMEACQAQLGEKPAALQDAMCWKDSSLAHAFEAGADGSRSSKAPACGAGGPGAAKKGAAHGEDQMRITAYTRQRKARKRNGSKAGQSRRVKGGSGKSTLCTEGAAGFVGPAAGLVTERGEGGEEVCEVQRASVRLAAKRRCVLI